MDWTTLVFWTSRATEHIAHTEEKNMLKPHGSPQDEDSTTDDWIWSTSWSRAQVLCPTCFTLNEEWLSHLPGLAELLYHCTGTLQVWVSSSTILHEVWHDLDGRQSLSNWAPCRPLLGWQPQSLLTTWSCYCWTYGLFKGKGIHPLPLVDHS